MNIKGKLLCQLFSGRVKKLLKLVYILSKMRNEEAFSGCAKKIDKRRDK